MTLGELKKRVDAALKQRDSEGFIVCIPNNKGVMGGQSVTSVKSVQSGFDWDRGKFIIYPECEMINSPKQP